MKIHFCDDGTISYFEGQWYELTDLRKECPDWFATQNQVDTTGLSADASRMRNLPLTDGDYAVLECVGESPVHNSHICEELDITANAARKRLKKLELHGLIVKVGPATYKKCAKQ